MFLDELQLYEEMEGRAISAAADISRDVTFETMIVGLLSKQILPDATVLGFSRSASFINQESEVYSFKKLSSEDVENFIKKATETEELRERILQQMRNIDFSLRNEILFLKQIIKIVHEGNIQLGEINTASDLFLTIILGNLSHQESNRKLGYSELSRTQKNNLNLVFQLCKENLQKDSACDSDYNSSSDDSYEEDDADGVIKGTKVGDETWQCDETDLEIPLEFLTSVGIFEVPLSDCGEVTLTAQHLSFIEFFAAAGILLSSDIKSELEKIQNRERFEAVSVYIRKYFV